MENETDLAVIVAGAGFGQRLRPLTDVMPKPACPLMGVPLMGYALARLHRAGVRNAVVNAHHLADVLVTEIAGWAGEHLPDLSLGFSVERPEILGTGGALVQARSLLDGDVVAVVNGDILCDFDLSALAGERARTGATASLLLAPHPDVERFGAVVVDDEGRVLDLAGLARRRSDAVGGPAGEPAGRGVFTGGHIARLAPMLGQLPPSGRACVVRQGYVPLMAVGDDVRGRLHPGRWNDLGTLERYLGTHIELLDDGFPGGAARGLLWGGEPPAGAQPAFAIDVDGRTWGDSARVEVAAEARLIAPVVLDEGCRIEAGAQVGPHAVLGREARIGAGARITRCVVWPGASVGAHRSVEDAVVFRDGKRNRTAT